MSNNKEPADNQLEDFKNSVKVNYFTKIFLNFDVRKKCVIKFIFSFVNK